MDIPENVLILRSRCRALYRTWWATHYSIGLLGIVSAALLTAIHAPLSDGVKAVGDTNAILGLASIQNNSWLLGVIATVCGSLVTLLGPIQKAEKYWSAFHLLDQSIMEYEQGLINMNKFAAKVSESRRLLLVSEAPKEVPVVENIGTVTNKDSVS